MIAFTVGVLVGTILGAKFSEEIIKFVEWVKKLRK
jgi:hypothetical protein